MTVAAAVASRRSSAGRFLRVVGFAVGAVIVYDLVLFLLLQQRAIVGTSALPAKEAFNVAIQQTINALSIEANGCSTGTSTSDGASAAA